jgi:aminoglycoside phosphotransferase (APT) family kinase protein
VLSENDVRAYLDTDLDLRLLLLGDEFETWAVGDDLIAKFPRRREDAAKVPVEVALHPTLRRLLGDLVPPIRAVGEMHPPGSRFIVHERALGTQGQTDDGETIRPGSGLAADVGRALASLHGVDAATAFELGAGERGVTYSLPQLTEATLAMAIEIAGDDVSRFLALPTATPSERRTLCHTDIKGEHIFVDGERRAVTAIIDWADSEVCDPARDYSGLVIWLGAGFARDAAEASGEPDATLVERAIWIARAGMLGYLEELRTGRERAPMALVRRQLQAAFSA